ncbi:MAG: protein adenylyltransferase SelO family protein, partial [Rhodoferax sp.]|nr:protein adenylyltransferase SelO family protein [Rhodoferax sp.]
FYRQPSVAHWNLFCLGQALLPLIEDQDIAVAALETYPPLFAKALLQRFSAKLGLPNGTLAPNALVEDLLTLLASEAVDYSIFWRLLGHWLAHQEDAPVLDLFRSRDGIQGWLAAFAELHRAASRAEAAQRMLANNPRYVLRNHLGELAIRAAGNKDFSLVATLLKVLQSPYAEQPEHAGLADFPPAWAAGIEISCSS